MSIAERMDELELTDEERDVLVAELESLASGPLDGVGRRQRAALARAFRLQPGAHPVHRRAGDARCAGRARSSRAIAGGAEFDVRLESPVAAVSQCGVRRRGAPARRRRDRRPRRDRRRAAERAAGRSSSTRRSRRASSAAIAAGQASTGIKVFIRARGPAVQQNAIRPGHPFGYLATEHLLADGEQVMIGFGIDGRACDAADLPAVQRQLDDIIPGYEVRRRDRATTGWPTSSRAAPGRSTAPGWYTTHHAEARRPEGRIAFAGSDIANGWSGFIDGAIESGFRGAALALDAMTSHRRAA